MNNTGFTLVEILVAVLIVIILVTMAAPIYDKAIEKSRLAEVRTTSKKLFDAKMRLMDAMDLDTYNDQFGFENLDFVLNCRESRPSSGHLMKCTTKDFTFWIHPNGSPNGICAVRIGDGDAAQTNFLYLGGEFTSDGEVSFSCHNGRTGDCEIFGMDSEGSSAWCTAN